MDYQSSTDSNSDQKNTDHFLDDFDFKPLSSGLGFHYEDQSKSAIQSINKVNSAKQNIKKAPVRMIHPYESHVENQSTNSNSQNFIQNDLSLFYSKPQDNFLKFEEEVVEPVEARWSLRFTAFIVDLLIVGSVVSLTMEFVSLMTGLEFWRQTLSFDTLSIASASTLFAWYFLMYFTVLRKFQRKTIGMDFFGLVVVSNRNMSLSRIFVNSSILLLGLMSFGLTNFFELPFKMTGIKVVQE
jgi:hypothetical protein